MRSKPNAFMGIDPGKSGAAALLTHDNKTLIVDWNDTVPSTIRVLREWRHDYNIILCTLEKVGAAPGQGVSSMFKFGVGTGIWIGILHCLKIPFTEVAPVTWMKGIVNKKKASNSKQASCESCLRLFPKAPITLKKHHGRADAILLAFYGRQNYKEM